MQDLIQRPIYESLPKTGYLVSKEEKKEKIYKNESHIHKQGPLSGVKAGAHRLYNDILTYFPKGFAGSKNLKSHTIAAKKFSLRVKKPIKSC